MPQAKLNLEPMSLVIAEAKRSDLTFAERAALYAAAKAYVQEIEEFISDHYPDEKGYELDKLHAVSGHLSILLGFGIYPDDKPHAGIRTAVEQDWYVFSSNMSD